jgi:hypothetical protein
MIDLQSNKLIVTSNANFNYIKVNGQKLPNKASVKLKAFGVGVKISKKAAAIPKENKFKLHLRFGHKNRFHCFCCGY